jgi:capsular exopolysaccharide synthesis family protein
MNWADSMGTMKKMSVLAGLAACALFAALSFTRDMVRSSQEARKKLDCECLGEIPHEEKYKTLIARLRRRKSGILITSPVTGFRFVENMRKLTRRVEQYLGDGKVLMVASVKENEGKSTVIVNLALTLARKQKKVLLIDCDLRKPACATLLETSVPFASTRDVLLELEMLPQALVRYKQTSLHMILERRRYANSADLLSSENMRRLLEWARKEFDVVLLDLPPMGYVTDAETVSDMADASLLIVRQNISRASAINRAIAELEGGKARFMGCIMNDVYSTVLTSGQGYGRYGSYGGYRGYGRYGSYAEKSSR